MFFLSNALNRDVFDDKRKRECDLPNECETISNNLEEEEEELDEREEDEEDDGRPVVAFVTVVAVGVD